VRVLLTVLYLLAFLVTLPAVVVILIAQPRKRAGLWQKLGFVPPRRSDGPCIWIHAVSVGETLAVKTFVQALRPRFPHHEVVVSVTTRTGMEVARKTYPDRRVFYYPFDFVFSVSAALRRIRPSAVLLVEQEVWPVFVRTCAARGIPVAVINGRITAISLRHLRRLGPLMRGTFRRVNLFAVQTDEYAGRIRALGVDPGRVHVTGSLKYDAVPTEIDADAVARYRRLFNFEPGHAVLLAGSTHPGEDEILLAAFEALRQRFPRLRLILVPRHPRRFDEVAALLAAAGRPFVRRSALAGSADKNLAPEIVLVDTMGELVALYSVADMVFVGGSLVPFGGHNVMDPAGLGKPVVVGPHTWNFGEAVEALVGAGGALEVSDGRSLTAAVERWLADPAAALAQGRRARSAVLERRGAAERTLALVAPLLSETPRRVPSPRGGEGN
jgi:3-deoxy-D-manno-octulosonic-acid transferase